VPQAQYYPPLLSVDAVSRQHLREQAMRAAVDVERGDPAVDHLQVVQRHHRGGASGQETRRQLVGGYGYWPTPGV